MAAASTRIIPIHRVHIVSGLAIQRQPNSRYLQARANIADMTVCASMRTEDWREATERAMAWYLGIKHKVSRGEQLRAVSWSELVASYVEQLGQGARRNYHIDTIGRHLSPFFGDFTDVSMITSAVILDYLAHRRTKNSPEPLPQTINRENTVLRQLLDHAKARAWISDPPSVPFFNETMTRTRRPHFTEAEYLRLRATALRRIRSAKYGGDNREVINILPYRQLLYDTIQIMANSGLRVDELHAITWRDVLWAQGDIKLTHAGKTRSNRKLVLRQPAIRALRRLALRRLRWQREHGELEQLIPNERIIALPDGTHVRQMRSSWENLLREAGFTYAQGETPHVITSLRHTYATASLTRRGGPRPSTHVLALQMGTSERMITRHYSHDTVEEHREILRGD
jgi:integrase